MKTSKQDLRGPRTAQDLQQMYGLGSGYVDSIVESGTLNGWYYEKWESGKAECWKRAMHIEVPISIVWGSLYRSDHIHETFPFLFREAPVCNVNVESNRFSLWVCCGSGRVTSRVGTMNIVLVRPTSVTVDSFTLNWHAVGRWK